MSKSFEERLETVKKNCGGSRVDGYILVSIDTPAMAISVGGEYVIYVQRFGPPPEGKFDPVKLQQIRLELNIA